MSIGPQHNGGILGATNNPTSTSAGGIWTPVQHYQAQRDGLWPVATAPLPDYTISRSLRFNSADPGYLSWTPGTIGNRRTWTWSAWVKKTVIATECKLFGSGATSSDHTYIMFSDNIYTDSLSIAYFNGSTHVWRLITTQVFRDPSAWYHIIVAFDSTLSTATDRVKVYVNGTQVTSFQVRVDPALNVETYINSNNTHYLGTQSSQITTSFNGYLADVRLIDGQQLTPSSFGETDLTTGVWKPKAYSGSYGTNGFYLPFTDNSTQNNLGVNTAQVGDELRNYTVLHLSGNPANTSGYNCFSDRSSNNHLLTIAGDVRTSARSPFTDTASGSAYFDGSSDYITVTNNNLFPATSTTAFTLEAWVYPTTSSGNYILTSPVASSTVRYCFMLGTNPDSASGTKVVFGRFSAAWTYLASATSVSLNTWTHIACVFTGSTSQIYINGNLDASGGASTWVTGGSSTLTLGYRWDEYAAGAPFYFTGNLSNVRVTTGQALFTGNFTPSSSPLTSTAVGHTGTGAASSITGTVSLLTLVDKVGANNSGFIDESTNNAVITRSGNVTQGSFSPFGTSGWSYYYNGSSWTSNPSSSAFAIGTKLYTIEFWAYFTSTPNVTGGTNIFGVNATGGWIFGANATNTYVSNYGIGLPVSAAYILPTNTWLHIAIARGTSDSSSIWINGTRIVNVTDSYNYAQGLWGIGGNPNGNNQYISAYISNGRVVLGYDLYGVNNATISVPTSPLTAVAGTTYLTAQSNQFIDNSANSASFTLNGTPQVQPLSPFQPHTSVTNTYSTYFNGANSITATTNSLFALPGAFTVEFWLYPTSNSGEFISITSTGGLDIGYQNSTTFGIAAAGVAWRLTTTTLPTLNAWNHIVFSRGGTGTNQASLFINGTRVANGTLSDSFAQGTTIYLGSYGAGYYLTGYLSNLRIVKDQDLYGYNNTQISVPTSPLTRTSQGATASNVALLTLQSSTLVDNGINTLTLFNNGAVEPRISEFNPLGRTFTTGVNYLASTHGSSAYFDGTTDYLTVPAASSIDLASSNFTIECWAFPRTQTNAVDGVFGYGLSGVSYATMIYRNGTTWNWEVGNGSNALYFTITATCTPNTWQHIAVTRSGNTFNFWLNGVLAGTNSTANAVGTASKNLSIGYNNSGSQYFTGYVSGFRLVKGTALYTSNFVPPMQPPQAVANTQLLLNFNNAGVVDYTGKNVLETIGDSRSVTSIKKSLLDATGSIRFDGSVDALYIPSDPKFGYGTADFTIEFWVNIADTAQRTIFSHLTSGSGDTAPHIYYENASGIRYYTIGANRINGSALVVGTWYHIALCRSSGSTRLFIDGVQSGSTYVDTNNYGTAKACIVGDYNVPPSGGSTFNGHIQDIRITKLARYTGTFTPPVRTFSATVRDVGHKQWVVNNLSVASGAGNDSLIDSPSNYGVDTGLGGEVRGNYCTLNPLWLSSSAPTLTNGNLDTTATNSSWNNSQGTFGISSGKWYWESTMSGDMFFQLGVGLREAINNVYSGSDVNSWTYDGRAFKNGNGSQPAYGATFAGGDIISVALDMDAGTLTFYKNGVSQGVAFSSGLAGKTVFPQFGCYQAGRSQSVNFGQRPFAYTAPSDYKALCTQNLPAPSIVKPNTAFDTALYTGNGTSVTVSGLNFSPDLVWMKARSGAFQHGIFDRVRGNGLGLVSNSTAVETSYAAGAFTNDGFTNTTDYNGSGVTYAAWSWDENPVAGVDIALATANASAVVTYNHSLDRKSTRLNSSHVSESRMPSSA